MISDFVRRRWTIRMRLTVLYGSLFFLAGLVLLAVTYVLMRNIVWNWRFSGSCVQVPADAVGKVTSQEVIRKQAELQRDLDAYRALTLRSVLQQGMLALVLVGVGAVALGWLVAGRVLRPIHTITATARRVADRNLHERIQATGPHDEVRELADTFDSMLDRLDRAFDGRRRFVGNASHELKTPLAISRTLIEVAMGRPDAPPEVLQLGQTLLEVNARQERLIDGLLTLARSEHTLTTLKPVDLAELCVHLLDSVSGVTVVSALDPAVASGDAVLLERLALNLIQNASRYNAPSGTIWVSTATSGELITLQVANTGPVVAANEIPALFEPFRRLVADRVGSARGTGLGLSIVRSVARAHGGDVHAGPRSPADGGGLVVTVSLKAWRDVNEARGRKDDATVTCSGKRAPGAYGRPGGSGRHRTPHRRRNVSGAHDAVVVETGCAPR
jgi:signal transduction histidine kinase